MYIQCTCIFRHSQTWVYFFMCSQSQGESSGPLPYLNFTESPHTISSLWKYTYNITWEAKNIYHILKFTACNALNNIYLTALVSKVNKGVSIHDPSIVCQYVFSSTALNITPLQIISSTQYCEVTTEQRIRRLGTCTYRCCVYTCTLYRAAWGMHVWMLTSSWALQLPNQLYKATAWTHHTRLLLIGTSNNRYTEEHIYTLISWDSVSCLNTNHTVLQLRQLLSVGRNGLKPHKHTLEVHTYLQYI